LNVMLEPFQIGHTTVQFEHVGCAISENGCGVPARAGREEHRHA